MQALYWHGCGRSLRPCLPPILSVQAGRGTPEVQASSACVQIASHLLQHHRDLCSLDLSPSTDRRGYSKMWRGSRSVLAILTLLLGRLNSDDQRSAARHCGSSAGGASGGSAARRRPPVGGICGLPAVSNGERTRSKYGSCAVPHRRQIGNWASQTHALGCSRSFPDKGQKAVCPAGLLAGVCVSAGLPSCWLQLF